MRLACCLLALITATAASAADASRASVTGTTMGGKPVLVIRAPAGGDLDARTAHRLRLPVTVDWREVDLTEALDQLARLTGATIVVDPELRAEAGNELTLQVADMRADKVLKWVQTLAKVEVTALNGGLYVSRDAPELPQKMTILDVSDIVNPVRDFPGPELAINAASGEEGGGLMFDAFGVEHDDEDRIGVEELAELIEETVLQE